METAAFSSLNNRNMPNESSPYDKMSNAKQLFPEGDVPLNCSSIPMKRMWWQRTIVRRTAAFVEADLKAITSESHLLQQPVPSKLKGRTAFFHRSEIVAASEPVGCGGFSQVYEIVGFELDDTISMRLTRAQQELRKEYVATAVDPSTGRGRFVIKHLKEELLTKKRKVDFSLAATDLAVEAAYMQRLDHPNILSLRGLPVDHIEALNDGKHDGYFLVLDRLVETLDQRISRWKRRREEANHEVLLEKAAYARQLASAIAYLHEHRIVFRDLKPANIGFNLDGELQLFDFGLCRELPDGDMDGLYDMSDSGTRRYMAPEVITAKRYNCKVDVYGWSMVVWQLLTLQKPYPHYTTEEELQEHVYDHGERPSLEYVPDALHFVLQQAWNGSVAERFSMWRVMEELDEVLSDERLLSATKCGNLSHSPRNVMMDDEHDDSDTDESNSSFSASEHQDLLQLVLDSIDDNDAREDCPIVVMSMAA